MNSTGEEVSSGSQFEKGCSSSQEEGMAGKTWNHRAPCIYLQPGNRDRRLLMLSSLSVFPSFTWSSSTPAHRVVLPTYKSDLPFLFKPPWKTLSRACSVSPLGEQTPEINNHTSQRRVRWCVAKQ